MTQINIFEKHTQKANEWLNQIEELTGSKSDRKKSLAALRTILHRLRDNLPIESVLHLNAQLPLLIKGILVENWHLSDYPVKDRNIDTFLDEIEEELHNTEVDVEIWTCAVFQVLSSHISQGEAEKIKNVLPHKLKRLWDEARAV